MPPGSQRDTAALHATTTQRPPMISRGAKIWVEGKAGLSWRQQLWTAHGGRPRSFMATLESAERLREFHRAETASWLELGLRLHSAAHLAFPV